MSTGDFAGFLVAINVRGMFIHIQALLASVGSPWRNLSDLDFVDLRCADLAPSNRRVPGCPVAADGGVAFFGVVFFGVCEMGCSTGRVR